MPSFIPILVINDSHAKRFNYVSIEIEVTKLLLFYLEEKENMMKYDGQEIGSKKCGITQVCVAMAMLAGAFLTLIIIGLVMNYMPGV
ncbi:MAG: hypothetical protein DSZ16_02665 [Candidatus Thioglobus sp.]|nr:MAG: hypothetical protein DSZ13_02715 [Candidatus Thioglobus sp.]RUM77733.1 MAG: hypothetical protein DSZ14_07160 [Candidatus Thioglobus sp.]RUM80311.1 MAG: hypothetical protein DSZ15_01150 [Candidatus Thioglobus sp.]RUM82230.1 MAG: hypothetical protein DSZ16_02665 [Candidatus Thioglobus sp.]RUM83192.1 MAG: hypothetical protein DSZ18_03525 [Candidatus Thioglobus sp.]